MYYILAALFSGLILTVSYLTGVFNKLNDLSWIEGVGVIANLSSYASILIPFVICIGAFTLARNLTIPKSYTEEVVGRIISIDYMNTKANMIKVGVEYQNHTKEFEYIRAGFSLTHKIGDTVIIAHHPDNIGQSKIDIDASIAAQNRAA